MNIDKLKGLVLAFLATAGWASFYIISRYFFGTDDDGLDPLWSSLLRYLLAGFALLAAVLAMKQYSKLKSALTSGWILMILLGLIGIAGESTLLFYSTKFTTAARANLLTNISPVVTAVMSWFITREVFSRKQIAGMILGTIGTFVIFFLKGGDDFTQGAASFLTGDLMAVAAGICWSAYTVMGERAVKEYGPLVTVCLSFFAGALVMVPVCLISGSRITLDITGRGWLMILYIGLVSNAFANFCWYTALKYLKPGVLGSFGYVSILMTFFLAVVCLGEKVSLPFALCLALILLGTGMMLKIPLPGRKKPEGNERGSDHDFERNDHKFHTGI